MYFKVLQRTKKNFQSIDFSPLHFWMINNIIGGLYFQYDFCSKKRLFESFFASSVHCIIWGTV